MATQRTSQRSEAGEERRRRIADAALEVLGTRGSRGLTHRAVDEAASLPEGSTSNYFRTRPALLEAAARRHVELDIPPEGELETAEADPGSLDPEAIRGLLLAALGNVLDPAARPTLVARYELTLEATRSAELQEVMSESRRRVAALTETLLRASDCESPAPHAAQLVAVLDGIAADALQAPDAALDKAGVEAVVDRFLSTC